MSFVGAVLALHISEAEGGPMTTRDAVRAVAGRGLEGDRYFDGTGTYSEREGPGRQVTLIEAEALEAIARDQDIDLAPGASRRNVTTRGVPLNHLVGREFTVGEVRMRGIKLCEPCGYLQRTLGIDHLVQALAHRAGLNAEILGDGEIRVGDRVQPCETP
ncbi:MAG: MOSC domain-containing protein [Acidimicrobiia bacterium]